jgi:hypothetical protein
VSKARDDLPEPLKPVKTTNWFLGIDRLMFLRLFSLAPFMTIMSCGIIGPFLEMAESALEAYISGLGKVRV